MDYGVNVLSVLPVRSAPDHKSEMVNQLLFGEKFSVLDETEEWQLIEGALDGYQGWITVGSALSLDEKPQKGVPDSTKVISQPMRVSVQGNPRSSFLILPGSSLPNLEPSSGEFSLADVSYKAYAKFEEKKDRISPQMLAQSALIFLNSPYLWGGRGMFGIDCSGLTQLAYKICGLCLPRDAGQQVLIGESRSFSSEAMPGDLAFFAKPEEDVSHVGLILDKEHIIHASGKVRVDKFDHQGIYQSELGKYSHTLRVIHKYLPE